MLSIASIALVPERAGTPYPNIDGSTTTNSSLSSSNNQPSSSSRGVYGKVEPVDTVDVSKIPHLDQANKDTGKPSGSLDSTNVLFAGSSRSATPQSSPMGPSSFTTASSSVSTSFVFNALSQNQSCYDFCVPPDVQVATGPTRILEMVNSAAEIFTKQGTSVTIVPIPKFFKLPVSDHIFDPKVLYDSLSGRWFASIGDEVTKNITIAVSFTNDPGGNWTLYQLAPSPNSNLADQPILGISGDKVVVSVNDFSISFATIFDGAQYWVLNKIEMLNRVQSIDYVSFGPDPELYSVHPAQSLGSTNTQYMVSNIFNPHTY